MDLLANSIKKLISYILPKLNFFSRNTNNEKMDTNRLPHFIQFVNCNDTNEVCFRFCYSSITSPDPLEPQIVITNLRIYQEIEKQIQKYSYDREFTVIFDTIEEFKIFNQLSKLFDSELYYEKDENDRILTKFDRLPEEGIKTYLLLTKEYSFNWLDNKIPFIINKERKNNMKAIRFITLSEKVKKDIIDILFDPKLTQTSIKFPNGTNVIVASITYSLGRS
jgi:hypothetical protein